MDSIIGCIFQLRLAAIRDNRHSHWSPVVQIEFGNSGDASGLREPRRESDYADACSSKFARRTSYKNALRNND